jgi:hypothetical protein
MEDWLITGEYISVDFQKTDDYGMLSMNTGATHSDLERFRLVLSEGLRVKVRSEDGDGHGNRDDLIAYAVVRRNPITDEWVFELDESSIQHESDGPL